MQRVHLVAAASATADREGHHRRRRGPRRRAARARRARRRSATSSLPARGLRVRDRARLGAGTPCVGPPARGAGARATRPRPAVPPVAEELDAVLREIPDEIVDPRGRRPAATAAGPRRPAARRLGPRAARADPHRRPDGAEAVRAARSSLARRRLDRAAHPRAQHLGARRALGRGQVGCLDAAIGADGRPPGSRARPVVTADGLREATTTSSSRTRRRQPARSHEGRPALPGRRAGGRRAAGALPRPAPHVRDPAWSRSGSRCVRSRSASVTPTAKTTQIYSHYAPQAHEVEMVNAGVRERVSRRWSCCRTWKSQCAGRRLNR